MNGRFLQRLLGALLFLAPSLALSQYRIVVGFAAGGSTDVVARLVATHAQQTLGTPMVVENRPGTSGLVGLDYISKASDDRTIGLLSSLTVVAAMLKNDPSLLNQVQGIGLLGISGYVVSVPGSSGVRSIEDLKRSGGLVWGTSGSGSESDICAHQVARATGMSGATFVPYKGAGPLIVDLLGGYVGISCLSATVARAHIASGKLRGLAATLPFSPTGLPSVRPIAESGITNVIPGTWMMVVARRSASGSSVTSLVAAIRRALADPVTLSRLGDFGFEPIPADDIKPEIAESFLRRQIGVLGAAAKLVQ